MIRSAREDAARRLARELDRAVETLAREARRSSPTTFQVGDAGVQRLERRVALVDETLERQRAERSPLERRLRAEPR